MSDLDIQFSLGITNAILSCVREVLRVHFLMQL
jgi:hypothetical protein